MNNEEIREFYEKSSINYSDIGSKEIGKLISCIEQELDDSDNELGMKVSKLRNCDVSYNKDGSIKNCYIMVDGSYFKRREAISFNTQDINGGEFIGFAGWASTNNVKPFINAFKTWLESYMI